MIGANMQYCHGCLGLCDSAVSYWNRYHFLGAHRTLTKLHHYLIDSNGPPVMGCKENIQDTKLRRFVSGCD